MIRFGLLISVILLASCTYQGDGNYQKDTSWLIFMPATYHKVEFNSFDLSEERLEYKFKNFCSSNSGFQLQMYLNSERPRHWPNEKAEFEVSLINKKGNSVYQASFSASEGNYVGISSVGNTLKSYIEIKNGGKTQDILMSSYYKNILGCDEYRIKVENLSVYPENSVTGRLYLVSSWK